MAMFSKKDKNVDTTKTPKIEKKTKKPKEKKAKKVKVRKQTDNKLFSRIRLQLLRSSRFLGVKFEEVFSIGKYSAGVALFLAMSLVFSVHSLGSLTLVKQVSDTIRNKDVTVEYDREKYVVEGIPSSVDVILYGDDAAIQSTKSTNSLTILADLSDLGAGSHVVNFSIENLPANMTAYTTPSSVKVNIYPKEFRVFPISAELINTNAISGLSLENPVLSAPQIELKGPAKDLERVSFVRALIDGKTINASLTDKTATSFEGRAIVVAYDEQGTKVDNITTDNGGIDYSISLAKAIGKPINDLRVNIIGNFPEGQAIKAITLKNDTVTINGTEVETAKISSLEVRFDLKNISGTGTVEGRVIVPEGVVLTSVAPQRITADIEFGPAEVRTLTIPTITKINGDENLYDYSVVNDNIPITVDVTGTAEQLSQLDQVIQTTPIRLLVDVANLGEGDQNLTLQIEGSSLYRYNLSQNTVKIRITKK